MQSLTLAYEAVAPSFQSRLDTDVPPAFVDDGALDILADTLRAQFRADGILLTWHRPNKLAMSARSGAVLSCDMTASWLATVGREAARSMTISSKRISCSQANSGEVALTLVIPFANSSFSISSLFCNAATSWDSRGRSELDNFAPVLHAYLELWLQRQNMQRHLCGLTVAIEQCNAATFLIGRRCELLFANNAGKELLAADCGLVERDGVIAAAMLSETLRLSSAVDHICSGQETAESANILAIKRKGHRPLMISIGRAQIERFDSLDGTVVARVCDPEQDIARLLEAACRFYSLSPGETRLTCAIVEGESLSDAAKDLGIREQTARSYLKQIFLKTETNRQAELVGLMLRSAMRTNHPHTQIF